MIHPEPLTLERDGVRLEPMAPEHATAWQPPPPTASCGSSGSRPCRDRAACRSYIDDALEGQRAGHMLPWVVRDLASDTIVGTTRYHDIVAAIDRVEIG